AAGGSWRGLSATNQKAYPARVCAAVHAAQSLIYKRLSVAVCVQATYLLYSRIGDSRRCGVKSAALEIIERGFDAHSSSQCGGDRHSPMVLCPTAGGLRGNRCRRYGQCGRV